jgi:hypothetical protein
MCSPLWAFVDHGTEGSGEPLSVLLRPGNAGSNTAADHINVIREALRQLPGHRAGVRPGRKILIRADAAGATHELLNWLVGQRLSYSVGFTLPDTITEELAKVPEREWQPAYDADGEPRPGAQLRLTDRDGHRLTAFATNTAPGGPHRQLADLELRHRRRARAEDRIRVAKDTGLRNLPLHDLAQNRIWCALVALACELTAWAQLLALTEHPARRWEPKRLRLRLFSIAGRLARTARRTVLHLSVHSPWAGLLQQTITTLRATSAPG